MSRIEELIESIKRPTEHYADQDFYDVDIERVMKEYAEEYARETLDVAADEAKITWDSGCDYDVKIIDKFSIINITLPEHI